MVIVMGMVVVLFRARSGAIWSRGSIEVKEKNDVSSRRSKRRQPPSTDCFTQLNLFDWRCLTVSSSAVLFGASTHHWGSALSHTHYTPTIWSSHVTKNRHTRRQQCSTVPDRSGFLLRTLRACTVAKRAECSRRRSLEKKRKRKRERKSLR